MLNESDSKVRQSRNNQTYRADGTASGGIEGIEGDVVEIKKSGQKWASVRVGSVKKFTNY